MTCEVVVIDGPSGQKTKGQDLVNKAKKRKRGSKGPEDLGVEEKEAKIGLFRKELDGLFGYYREVMSERGCLDLKQFGNDLKSVIGALMEESALPLSKLVDEVFQKLKNGNDAFGDVTLATVKKIVLLVGQREMYGVPNADADVLEDESESCLWCWETRDVKLMPASVRGVLNIRRTCRRKINERITAVSAMIMALQKPESDQSYIQELMKASEMIDKASCEAKIRSLMDRLSLKNSADMVKKQAKREEQLQIKQMERDKREAEKEKQRLERERQKEELQNEKEQKRLLEESEKVEKRREKEESEIRKLRRKQQEDAEKEQRRREKEEAKLKDQLSIKKQASIMDRFLKRTKPSPACQNDQLPAKGTVSISSSKNDENLSEAVTQSMDHTLSSNDKFSAQDIRRSHLSSWRHLGHSIRSNRNQSWGIRRKPKSELFKELKLTTSKELVHGDDSMEKLVDRWGEPVNDERSCQILAEVKKFKSRKQLLQFDKSHRPAFYGIWSKKSHVVRPCHPLRKDPDLDYDIDSDEDWEEEDPGESLSDCDKDDEGESLEEGCSKADDEDESEDGFFVPDGYLSENEGVEVDRMETDITCEETKSPSCKQDSESEKFSSLLRQQKYLGNLTERALQKNQPLIISNLMHEKASLLMVQDLSGTPKLEQMCLQALSMHVFPGDSLVEIIVDGMQEEDPEVYLLNGKCSIKSSSAVAVIPELDLPAIVSVIQSCSQSINKVLQALQQKFPAASKTQLRIIRPGSEPKRYSIIPLCKICWSSVITEHIQGILNSLYSFHWSLTRDWELRGSKMNREWIHSKNKLSQEYRDGILSFIDVAKHHLDANNETLCPCVKCQNYEPHSLSVIRCHLAKNGMAVTYETWTEHGETKAPQMDVSQEERGPNDDVFDILNDVFPQENRMDQDLEGDDDSLGSSQEHAEVDDGSNMHRVEADKYEKLLAEAEREFFPGSQFSVLTAMLDRYVARSMKVNYVVGSYLDPLIVKVY